MYRLFIGAQLIKYNNYLNKVDRKVFCILIGDWPFQSRPDGALSIVAQRGVRQKNFILNKSRETASCREIRRGIPRRENSS